MSNYFFELEEASNLTNNSKFEEAEAVFRNIYERSSDSFNNQFKNDFAKCIFINHMENSNDIIVLEQSAKEIINLVEQEDCSQENKECYRTKAVLKLTNLLKSRNPHYSIFWFRFIKPELLTEEETVSSTGSTYESSKEKYYLNLTQSLFEDKRFEDCINSAKEGIKNIQIFRNKTIIHLNYRIAKSFLALDNYEESTKYLMKIRNNRDWYIDSNIAFNYFYLEDYENALKHALLAALIGNNINSKVKLYELMDSLFILKGMNQESEDVADLSFAIRSNEPNSDIQLMENNLRKCWRTILEELYLD